VGIAHTRWATHGKPDTVNAHPHFSGDLIGLVHNGIIENYESLREELKAAGYVFVSQTDTEVIAHLIHQTYIKMPERDLAKAVRAVVPKLHGAYAIAVIAKDAPGLLIGARVGSPLVVAYGDQENFLASDALAVSDHASMMAYLEEGDIAVLTTDQVIITDVSGKVQERIKKPVPTQSAEVDLGPYQHYMQKEIFEQPRAVADTLGHAEFADLSLFGANQADWKNIDSVLIFGLRSPVITQQARLSIGLKILLALPLKLKLRVNTDIAKQCRTLVHWWWWFLSQVKQLIRWPH